MPCGSPEPWDVVHYAGHSYHAPENPALASLIVSGATEPVAVRINELAPYLRHSKLVYLSSCNSANAGFAFEAVQQGIPAVVGFRWGVRDDFADIHARLFYRKLFKERAIDTRAVEDSPRDASDAARRPYLGVLDARHAGPLKTGRLRCRTALRRDKRPHSSIDACGPGHPIRDCARSGS